MTSADSLLKSEGYPLLMKVDDMCRLFGVCPKTLYRRIKSGDVPAWERFGARGRFEWLRPNVEQWLQRRRVALRRSA